MAPTVKVPQQIAMISAIVVRLYGVGADDIPVAVPDILMEPAHPIGLDTLGNFPENYGNFQAHSEAFTEAGPPRTSSRAIVIMECGIVGGD